MRQKYDWAWLGEGSPRDDKVLLPNEVTARPTGRRGDSP